MYRWKTPTPGQNCRQLRAMPWWNVHHYKERCWNISWESGGYLHEGFETPGRSSDDNCVFPHGRPIECTAPIVPELIMRETTEWNGNCCRYDMETLADLLI